MPSNCMVQADEYIEIAQLEKMKRILAQWWDV
jgi:hypothetical protein